LIKTVCKYNVKIIPCVLIFYSDFDFNGIEEEYNFQKRTPFICWLESTLVKLKSPKSSPFDSNIIRSLEIQIILKSLGARKPKALILIIQCVMSLFF